MLYVNMYFLLSYIMHICEIDKFTDKTKMNKIITAIQYYLQTLLNSYITLCDLISVLLTVFNKRCHIMKERHLYAYKH